MQLRRLTSPKMCSQQAGHQREDDVAQVPRPAGRTYVSAQAQRNEKSAKKELKAVGQEDTPFYSQETQSFCSIQAFN